MAHYLQHDKAEAAVSDAPGVRIWRRAEHQPLGRLLVWNTGTAGATVSLFTAPQMDGGGNPQGAETVIASATIAAGGTYIFDGTPSGGGSRDSSPLLFVRFAAATPGQPTTLKFADAIG